MNSCANLIRNDLKNFQAYASARRENGRADIMLNANERAWPNKLYPDLNRYPEQQPKRAIQALAAYYQVNAEQLLITRGSDEGIELLIRLFCMPGEEAIMICPPTFGMYSICAKLQAVQCHTVPLLSKKQFALDTEGLSKAWTPETKLIFLCSPNNPTGTMLSKTEVQQLCQTFKGKAIVVLDEAYIEFSSAESLASEIQQYENLVILRTLSKAFGLAGARCGVTLANPFIIEKLQAVMAPYPIPGMLAEIIENNLTDSMKRDKETLMEKTREQKQQLCNALKEFSFIQSIKNTEANFILIQLNNCRAFLKYCESRSILLRDMSGKLNMENTVRISIGTASENQRLINCMREYDETE